MSYETAITIKQAILHIQKKQYVLPSIQREFVWSVDQIATLFDSLMRDYPIGTFLFWQVDKTKIKDFEFYEFLAKYHEKNSRHNKKAHLADDESVIALLDGQQRMTSLYLALCGSYAERKKHARKNDLGAYHEKFLYLNLIEKSEDPEMVYDFRFLTPEDAEQAAGVWFKCADIMKMEEISEVYDYLISHHLTDGSLYEQDEIKHASRSISQLYKVIHMKPTISYFLERGEELDKVLQIFIRINSGGTKLSYSDLLLSIATAQWSERDAREIIHDFVDELNAIGDGFSFNKDIILKACLVLPGFSDIKFKVDNFTKANMSRIEQEWPRIAQCMRRTVQLVSGFGYNGESLLSTNAIIPIAYFIYWNRFEESILGAAAREGDRRAIRDWLARVLLKGVFGGQPDSVYPVMRKLIEENGGRFPLDEITERYRRDRRNILFSDDEIEGLLDLQYGKAKTYCALTLLYPSLNHDVKFHQDHIYPKSLFSRKKLLQGGMGEADVDRCIERVNELANLQMLESVQNMEKLDMPFDAWLTKRFPDERVRHEFLLRNHIKPEQDFSIAAFASFADARRATLKEKLSALLGSK